MRSGRIPTRQKTRLPPRGIDDSGRDAAGDCELHVAVLPKRRRRLGGERRRAEVHANDPPEVRVDETELSYNGRPVDVARF